MYRPTVLILADHPAFAREITANWPQDQSSCHSPGFILLDMGFCDDIEGGQYDLAIVDTSSISKAEGALRRGSGKRIDVDKALKLALIAAAKPAILIHSGSGRESFKAQGLIVEMRCEAKTWPALTGFIGREILRRREAELRASEANQLCAAAQADATLGRYMVEMRTHVNNALTTVLGNAELLVNEIGLPASIATQADAIRNMALRLHEVFRRFSSLEKELNVAARVPRKSVATAAGVEISS
jgi:hypothetical protein